MDAILSSILFMPPKASYSSRTLSNLRRIGSVPCLHIKRAHPRGVIMYLHGNSVDLGLMGRAMYTLSDCTCCDVVVAEYPGYGICPGTPSVASVTESVHQVLDWIERHYTEVPVYVVGRSIGTGIAMEVIAKHGHTKPKRVFLISPFESISQLAYEMMGTVAWTICPDVFRTIDNIHACPCPVDLIHGELDLLIPPQHSQNLHARHRKKTTLHIIDGDPNNLD